MEECELKGMTVNERLFHLGLMEQFETAVKSRSKDGAIKVLKEAQFTLEQATQTVTTLFNNPKKYGY